MQQSTGGPPFPKHFDGKRYFNPDSPQASGFLNVLRWKFSSRPDPSPRFVDDVVPSKPPADADSNALRVTLVNHSTVLLQQGGANLLTDPVWSERVSPIAWIGPRRKRKPGVRWEDLPRIDAVLLSHNHYDHLDLATLRRIGQRDRPRFVVPLGVAALLKSHSIGPVDELDWGDALPLAGGTLHCVPALHFSARGLFDRNKTLWCGYVIEAAGRIVYFAADTAFGAHFGQIRERFGSPRLALLPIGAYKPRWFMSPVHMAPEEAVLAHKMLAAEISIAIHHGTFRLADESLDAPKRELMACRMDDSFMVLDNGQSVTLA